MTDKLSVLLTFVLFCIFFVLAIILTTSEAVFCGFISLIFLGLSIAIAVRWNEDINNR